MVFLLYNIHPNMEDFIVKPNDKDQYKCLAYVKHRRSNNGAALKSMVDHFKAGYHIENVRKQALSEINQEIIQIFFQ